ncbi:MAG: DMP19 family protein [Planctomycetes bacterium]|nr:DMP19 family protein [Planctomycetota bacterium]
MTDAEYLDSFNREFWRTLHGPGVAPLSRLQRDAICVMNFQAELNNGGMDQYLLNSSGDFAQETPDVFRRIGAEEAARILEEANAFFGLSGPPTDREARMAALLALPKNAEDRIYALSKEFYDAEDRGLSLADLFDEYVLSQKGKGGG